MKPKMRAAGRYIIAVGIGALTIANPARAELHDYEDIDLGPNESNVEDVGVYKGLLYGPAFNSTTFTAGGVNAQRPGSSVIVRYDTIVDDAYIGIDGGAEFTGFDFDGGWFAPSRFIGAESFGADAIRFVGRRGDSEGPL